MRFATKEDLNEPLDAVFAVMADFPALQHLAARRGIDARRADRMSMIGAGMRWDVTFRSRGKPRRGTIDLATYDSEGALNFLWQSANLHATVALSLVALARNRTRLAVEMEVLPKSVAARIIVQSARLGKKRLDHRFRERVHDVVRTLMERARR